MNTFHSPPNAKSPCVKFSYASPTHHKTSVFSPSAPEVGPFRTLVSVRTAPNVINSPRFGQRQREEKKNLNMLTSSVRWKREEKENMNSDGKKSASQSVILYKNPEESTRQNAQTSFCLSDLASRIRSQQLSTVKSLIVLKPYPSQQNCHRQYGYGFAYSRVLEERVGQQNEQKRVFNFSKVKPRQRRVEPKLSNAKIEDFLIGQMIGKGGIGRVFLSKHRKTGFYYALKVIRKAEVKDVDQLAFSIKCHFFLSHTNIAQLYACFCDQTCIYLVMEICIDGNLSKYRKKIKNDEERQYLMQGISRGVQYMHNISLRHGDLKLQNILINHGFPKITDFDCIFNGRHKQFRQERRKSKLWGSPAYFSPDMMREQSFTLSDDVWALGVIMYEVYCNAHPFSLKDADDLGNLIEKEMVPLPNALKQSTRTLISSMLVKDREERVTIDDVMRQLS